MTAAGTSGRLLTLLSLLQSRAERAGPDLTARLGVSARTLRRDIERLRGLGYPVESVPGPAGGYRLRAGAAMPPLLLDDEEAVAIAVGLLTAARSGVTGVGDAAVRALVKLEQVLPAPLRAQVEALGSIATSVAPGGGPTVAPAVLMALAGACRERVPVRFDYTAR
ncbi:MAG: HTH domain-containing protein, partial [Miltoncostaeaceae bacterium]